MHTYTHVLSNTPVHMNMHRGPQHIFLTFSLVYILMKIYSFIQFDCTYILLFYTIAIYKAQIISNSWYNSLLVLPKKEQEY